MYQQRGQCLAQKDPSARAACFEKLTATLLEIMTVNVPDPLIARTPPRDSDAHQEFIRVAKQRITSGLKDPSSVQWQDLYLSQRHTLALCGQINAKNSYGAYVGFKRFYSAVDPLFVETDDGRVGGVFAQLWPFVCANKIAAVE